MSSSASELHAQLSKQELQQLYDDEEAERFLHFFSTYVTEVRVPHNPDQETDSPMDESESLGPDNGGAREPTGPSAARSLSERIATNIVLPLLPPPTTLPPPPFSVSRFHLTVQRLYLALEPVYYPFIAALVDLATWANRARSFIYCLIFWVLWWHDLLLPSLFLRILYSLLRRRVFAYPTYAELLERRRQVNKANKIGNDLSSQLTSPTLSVKEALVQVYKIFLSLIQRGADSLRARVVGAKSDTTEDPIASEDAADRKRLENLMRNTLDFLNHMADLHERVKNVFIWRRPASSRLCGNIIFLMFLATYFAPTQYLSKFTYFCCGFSFWHITPIIAALPPGSLSRIPPPLSSVPTDAEYATQLISKRVADKQTLTPRVRKPQQVENQDDSRTQPNDQLNWGRWGNHIAAGKSWANQQKQMFTGRDDLDPPESSDALTGDSHSYPAQCHTTTGLLTVTSNVLHFTPAMSMNASVEIPFHALRSAKKSDLLKVKGLKVRWMDPASNGSEKEQHFIWVGGRDELFARLVAHGEGRWRKV